MSRPVKRESALVPAAARGLAPSTQLERDLSADAIKTFTIAIGGRDALRDILAIADRSADVAKVLDYLLDPRYDQWSLRRLCSLAGLTVADLFTAYRKATLAKAHIEATHVIAGKLVGVVRDVMDRAAPRTVPCGACGGLGRTLAPDQPAVLCVTCHGAGTVEELPDLDRQKLALELGQLTQKGGGIVLQQNNANIAPSSIAPGALEQLQQAVGEILARPDAPSAQSPPEGGDILDGDVGV